MGISINTAIRSFLIALALSTSSGSGVQAALLFERGLPTENINNTAPNNPATDQDRSNVSWGFADLISSGYSYPIGDDFVLGTTGQTYLVDTLRVWVVIGVVNTTATISDHFWQSFTLWGGQVEAGIAGLSTLHTGPTNGSDLQVNISQVTYSNGENYWAEPVQLYRKIWQIDFSGLNWTVKGGNLYQFFVDGSGFTSAGIWNVFPTLHASNADLSDSSQAGADDFYRLLRIYQGTPDYVGTWNSNNDGLPGTYRASGSPGVGGWNKSSDVNVQIYGNLFPRSNPATIPEPTSVGGLLGIGVFGIGVWLKRKRSDRRL
ncbi:MAG: PEP-CTERM sorting domain-containing protein [Trichocoleus desertorum ATA4-8-CV12]|nr:PEP-CTERM sorting domain-containing protein [Trichocoleus desertorum ATA4-8-CV12]